MMSWALSTRSPRHRHASPSALTRRCSNSRVATASRSAYRSTVMRPALLRRGSVAVLIAATAGASVASGAAASGGFPPSIYPPAVHSRGAVSACPNPEGLHPFTPPVTSAAVASASRYDRVSEAVDLRASDRAWWPQVRTMWRTGRPGKGVENQVADGSEPLDRSGYAVIVRFSCGQSLVSRSLQVTIGPRHMRCAACRSQLFFVDRRGHALLYYVY